MLFLDADISYRNVYCNACNGTIGGARLFCLDCVPNQMVEFDTVDLCCEPQCVAARIPQLPGFDVAHEPNHRLVKARIPMLLRSFSRTSSAAHWASGHIRYPCVRIAESTAHPQEKEKTGLVEQKTPNHGPTFAEIPANVDKVDDALTTPREEEMIGPDKQETPSYEPTVAEMSVGVDKVDDVLTAQDGHCYGSGDGDEAKDSASQHSTEVPIQNENLPTCGNCKGRLTFPCWYCIFCKGGFPRMNTATLNFEGIIVVLDDLFICAACDRAGVPMLKRSSGEHTEGHHLIRCQGPQIGRPTFSPTEQPLPMEGRLSGMEMQLDDLTRRMGDHNDRMGDLNERVGGMANLVGELTGSITSLTSRIADIELLINRLAGAANVTV
jgi:hypothetical protein